MKPGDVIGICVYYIYIYVSWNTVEKICGMWNTHHWI